MKDNLKINRSIKVENCNSYFRNRQDRVKHLKNAHGDASKEGTAVIENKKKSIKHQYQKANNVPFSNSSTLNVIGGADFLSPPMTPHDSAFISNDNFADSSVYLPADTNGIKGFPGVAELTPNSFSQYHNSISPFVGSEVVLSSNNFFNNSNNMNYETLPLNMFITPKCIPSVGFNWKIFLRSFLFFNFSAGIDAEQDAVNKIYDYGKNGGLVPVNAQTSIYVDVLERLKNLNLDIPSILTKRQSMLIKDMVKGGGVMKGFRKILTELKGTLLYDAELKKLSSSTSGVNFIPAKILSELLMFILETYRRTMNNDTTVELVEVSHKSRNWCNPGDCGKSQLGLRFKLPYIEDIRVVYLKKQEFYAFTESVKYDLQKMVEEIVWGDEHESILIRELCCKGLICDLGKLNSKINFNLSLIDSGEKLDIKYFMKIGFDKHWVMEDNLRDSDDLFVVQS
ncbi:hypothetical protein HK099_007154 [Clydaea vesicula]|uniref:Uncharacterized protein n=1 Tax=Clydaea vesicula TaxID=447962 RepID=A0AAD5U9M0_9FUNG|nr:hypothetical protein HK099_007154 [Clydaea vesicula]